MLSIFRRLMKNDRGATAIEYTLIASLIAVAAITAMGSVGTKVNGVLSNVASAMSVFHLGSDREAERQELDVALEFIRTTGVDVFAPAIGNAHGHYKHEPTLDFDRVSDIVAAEPVPIALHGGTGMTDAQFQDLISRGCAKVNISTALKMAYMKANLGFLRSAQERDSWDPPSLFTHVRAAVIEMAVDHMRRFGSVGRAG